MAVAGRVAIVPKGEWSANATYKRLDAVTHNNTLYFAKKNVPAGTVTSNTEYWSKSIVGGASAIATTEDAGVVKPDGKSMSVDESGTLSINLDGATITLDEAKNVIKLADTLKDKIGSALQPESIVNNQITTEEGFALDARQANPNIDGSLAKQVAELNSNLKGVLNEVTIHLPQSITVLGYINSMDSPIGCQTFNTTSFVSDSPISTGEFSVLWFGSGNSRNGMRYHVIAIPYSANPNVSKKIYARELFNQRWNTDWYEL